MQYTFTFTPRMVMLAGVCLAALCVLLFVAGVSIGQKMAGESIDLNVKNIPKKLPAVKAPKLPNPATLVAPLVPNTP